MRLFEEYLVEARNQIIEKDEYLPLTLVDGQYINISNEIPRAIPAYEFSSYTRYGVAAVILTRDTGVPVVEESAQRRLVKVFDVRLGFRVDYDELELADAIGEINPVTAKLADTRVGIDQKLDIIGFVGQPGTTMLGMATSPNITTIDFPPDGNQNGATNSAAWSDKTPAQVLRDLNLFALTVPEQTSLTKRINRILMPASSYLYIQSTPYNTGTGDSILTVFLKNQTSMPNGGVTDIVGHPVLETYGFNGSGLMFGYNTASNKNSFHIPQGGDFKDLEASLFGTTYTVPCQARTAGVQIERTLEVVYANLT